MINKIKISAVVFACTLVVCGVAAQARTQTVTSDQDATTVQQQVQLGDLDLASHAGQVAARWRLHEAAEAVCETLNPDPNNQLMSGGCRDEALLPARKELARLTQEIHGASVVPMER